MQTTKERVSKVTLPEQPLSYNEWVKMYKFGKAYIKPTPFFQGNEIDTKKFVKTRVTGTKVWWQDLLKTPFEIILKSTLRAW